MPGTLTPAIGPEWLNELKSLNLDISAGCCQKRASAPEKLPLHSGGVNS